MRHARKAFTLIELLVVVTIIVVLLALLLPAMDKAIMETEMALCMARLRSIATGLTTYAADAKRYYPARAWRKNAGARPNLIYDPGTVSPGTGITDERIVFKTLIGLQAFMDPFVENVKIDEGSNRADTYIYIPTNVYGGWQYQGQKGMIKIGDRFTYPDRDEPGKVNQFDVIATDMDQIRNDLVEIHSSHPDKSGLLPLVTFNNTNLVQQIPGFVNAAPHTFSEWVGGLSRGKADYNYALADNSVVRINDVAVSHAGVLPGDERMDIVSINHANNQEHWHAIPARP